MKIDNPAPAAMPTIDPETIADATEPKYREQDIQPSDLVVDRGALPLDEFALDKLMLVLYERAVPADSAGVVHDEEGPTTVAELNPDYSPDETVFRVAYLSGLDRQVPNWTEWDSDAARNNSRGFHPDIKAFHREWRVATPTYDFPASRLMPVGTMQLPETDDPMTTEVIDALDPVTLAAPPDTDG